MATQNPPGIDSPVFWLRQWDKLHGIDSDTARVSSGYASARYWDAAAKEYDHGLDAPYHERLEDLVARLEKSRMLTCGTTVLDLGCGTGTLAFLLAGRGARVTAVDFSGNMLQQAKANCPDSCKDRVRFEQADWTTVDLEKKGWLKKFDLVLAHMTPAVNTPDLFLKMMAASRQSCCTASWAGKRENNLRSGLWEKMMQSPLQDQPVDFLIRFNLLYAMGYFPDIYFTEVSWEKTMSVESALDYFIRYFKEIAPDPESVLRKKIRGYLDDIAVDKKVIKKNFGRIGTLCWHLNQTGRETQSPAETVRGGGFPALMMNTES